LKDSLDREVCDVSAKLLQSTINSWATIRYELLNTRICDLDLRIVGSPLEPLIQKLRRELTAKQLRFRPRFYLTDAWGCPDQVPVIGIPFYLADRRLARIEEEQTGEVEDDQTVMMFLRHEAGHAFNYAYRLWQDPERSEVFGPFSKPYREAFQPQPTSRQFVRHIFVAQYGPTYAQKHPDEDFAETFAVWLTPRSSWRRKYRSWPALRKLKYVDRLMRGVRGQSPLCTHGALIRPIEKLRINVAEHYGQRAERFRSTAQGYVDDRLREVFPPVSGKVIPARVLLKKHRNELADLVIRWTGLTDPEIQVLMDKLEDRCEMLQLRLVQGQAVRRLVDLAAMVTAVAMELAYTGRLMG